MRRRAALAGLALLPAALRAAPSGAAAGASASPASTHSRSRLAELPARQFQGARQGIRLTALGSAPIRTVAVNGELALLCDGRHCWLLRAGSVELQRWQPPATAPGDAATWYGPACAVPQGFALGVSRYPDAQREAELDSPLGGFRAGPGPQGLLLLRPEGRDQLLPAIKVRSRPPVPPAEAALASDSDDYAELIQSCAWDGERLLLGSYGSFGRLDLEQAAIDLLDEDRGLTLNRHPLLLDDDGSSWLVVSEGGMGGEALQQRGRDGLLRQSHGLSGADEDDIVSFTALARHQGLLVVGSSHGLLGLDEAQGRFWRFDLGRQISDPLVTDLVSHQGWLWACIGGQWLQLNPRNRQMVRQLPATPTPLTLARPFGSGWLLAGPDGVWWHQRPGAGR